MAERNAGTMKTRYANSHQGGYMTSRAKPLLKLLTVLFAVGTLYIPLANSPLGATSFSENVAADSGESAQNPCNPCSKKKGAKNPCNPCAKKAQNPCNPCGGKMVTTGKVYRDATAYRSWTKLTEPTLSMGHGGKYVVAYANSSADATIKSDKFPFKNGAKLVKEGYDDAGGHPGDLTALYVMEKRGKDWYYAMTDVNGHIQMEGMSQQAQMCASCHAGAKKTDYVFTAMQLTGESPGKMPMNPCNPCNPCAKKKSKNPCNPCGKKKP
jgi:hypothetical protein